MSNMSNSSSSHTYIEPHTVYFMTALIKLTISICLSCIIGIEREMHSHPGGICTHMLVGLGSCLYTMISIHINDSTGRINADPSRICAQIVSGVGFLGSATIFKSSNYVKGINTAANLWISAAISMAIGADLWELGLIASLFVFVILFINNRYKHCRYGNKKTDEKQKDKEQGDKRYNDREHIDIEIGTEFNSRGTNTSLPRDSCNAPYGDENEHHID